MGACLGRNRKENSSAVSHGQTRESRRHRNDEINGSPQFSGLTFVIKLLLFYAVNIRKGEIEQNRFDLTWDMGNNDHNMVILESYVFLPFSN